MSGFLYYIPGLQAVSADDVKRAGLDFVWGGSGFSFREVAQGPDSVTGCVVARNNFGGGMGYYPDRQDWKELKSFWIGLERDRDLTPEDLKRPDMVWGHNIQLADDNDWQIPVAHAVDRQLVLGDDGQWEDGKTLGRFDVLNEHAEKIFEVLCAETEGQEDAPTITPLEAAAMCVDALAVNYYVGPQEVNLLGLLTSRNVLEVLKAVVDLPTLIEAAKKKGEGVPTISGDVV